LITFEQIHSAWDGLMSHKLRSTLTTLGVIFGVAAVIAMASIGEGAQREALKQIELMGATNILIDESRPEDGEQKIASLDKNPQGLTLKDANAVREIITDAVLVVPMNVKEVEVTAGSNKVKLNVVAASTDLFNLYNLKIKSGRRLNNSDEDTYKKVCVIGAAAQRELFPLSDPLNRQIRIKDQIFTVVGVVSRRASGGGEIQGVELRDENRDIYIPFKTFLQNNRPVNGESELTRITVQLSDPSQLMDYSRVIRKIMQRRHNDINDYSIVVPEELLRQHQATQRIFNIVMGTIASISLLVGGIGIMNIMLASVLERTREIGIRRAVGAKQSDIARQFLTEAVLLSLSGGIIGVFAGVLLATSISIYADWETAVSLWAIAVALGVSVTVGIVFGWLPARRAAKMDPITALRSD
jgi:putative ABC transport system permease protein